MSDLLALPLLPGTAPIPLHQVYRFHCTDPSNIPSIIKNGLVMTSAQGIEGPRAIYSWPTFEKAQLYSNRAIVEFYDSEQNYEPGGVGNPYFTTSSIPPSHILAVHYPWHNLARYVIEHRIPREQVGEFLEFDNYKKVYDWMVANHIE